MKCLNLSFLITLLLFSCSKDDENSPELKGGVTYNVTFNINWNATDFPVSYPSNAHFSPLIGWSHASNQTFF